MTKCRFSNHRLAVETGRHNDIPRERRLCTFCTDKIEDEAHFLFECTALRHLRHRYLDPVTDGKCGFEFFPNDIKLKTLMSDVKYDTRKFIADGSDLRTFLISNPKRVD